MPTVLSRKPGGSGGGGAPSGPAGGDLAGTYPNPTISSQGSSDGFVLTSDGAGATAFEYPPGFEFEYEQFTGDVSISATAEGSADTIVTAGAVTFDGATLVEIRFFSQCVRTASAVDNQIVIVDIFEDGTAIGRIGQIRAGTVGAAEAVGACMYGALRRTPAAGSRTYSARAWVTIAGTAVVQAGAGGATASVPGFISIVKV